MDEEGLQSTSNKLIHIGRPIPMENSDVFLSEVEKLDYAAKEEDEDIRTMIKNLVSTYNIS